MTILSAPIKSDSNDNKDRRMLLLNFFFGFLSPTINNSIIYCLNLGYFLAFKFSLLLYSTVVKKINLVPSVFKDYKKNYNFEVKII